MRRRHHFAIPKAHWKVFAASDVFSVEVWTARGLETYYVLFIISLADRVVQIAGITTRPDTRHNVAATSIVNKQLLQTEHYYCGWRGLELPLRQRL